MPSSLLHATLDRGTSFDQLSSTQTYFAAPTAPVASSTASLQVLVLAPHPDDESLGCGGTLRQLTEGGVAVDVAYMTRGELGNKRGSVLPPLDQLVLASQRAQEGLEACRILGVRNVHFLGGRDGAVSSQPELAEQILQLLNGCNYNTVFCPWAFDFHPDHSGTFDHLVSALRACDRRPEVWLYEVWSTLHPNRVVCIDTTIDSKLKAAQAHASQMQNYSYDYSDCFQALSRYRAILVPGMKHAEAFYVCDRDAALSLRSAGPTAERSHAVRQQLAATAMAS